MQKQSIEEKIKVTSLEIIVTGTKDKPYFEIKYKEVGKEDYHIGYSSYDLNNVFGWKEEYFEIVNQVASEYAPDINVGKKEDVCEWKYDGAIYDVCPHEEALFKRIHDTKYERAFKYCPCCGKKIKAVE